MSRAALLLAEFIRILGQGPGRVEGPTRHGRRVLAKSLEVMGAVGGGICAWDTRGGLVLSASKGLAADISARFRRVVQTPPVPPGLLLAGMECRLLSTGRGLGGRWEGLAHLADSLTERGFLAVWPLAWREGSGLALLLFASRPEWERGFASAAAGCLGLTLTNIVLSERAQTGAEDYRRIFLNSRDMVYLSSREGRWVDVNPAGVSLLGYDSKEQLLKATDIAQAFYANPMERRAFTAAIEKDGFVRDYEVAFRRKDGTLLDVSITAQVRREQGQVVGYEGIIKDITEKKRAEAQAERQRRLVASILEVMPVAVFVVDKDHRVIHWNRACHELTGHTAGEMLGTQRVWEVFQRPPGISLADLILEGDWDRLHEFYGQQGLRPSSLGHEAWEAQGIFSDLGGRRKDLFFTASPVRDPEGQIWGAVEVILDLTDMRALQELLKESEALYRLVVEANREGMALHDGEGFVFANQPFLRIFGLADLAQSGGDLLELLAPSCRRPYLAWLKDLKQEGGQAGVYEGQGQRGAEVFDLEATAAPAVYKGGPALLFNVRDVSERRRMEEQLLQSERLAATGKLAFDIAHEVNNPLGGILTYAHLAVEDMGQDSSMRPTMERIIQLANRCKIIVRGLLDFARQEKPEKELCDVNQIVNDTLALVEGHVILKGVELSTELGEGLPPVYGHRTKLEQVFLNLVVNAAEAMEGRGGLVISTWREGRDLRVCFADQGPGMEAEVAGRVFEPFFTTKARGRGTGLGLAISFGIIKQHQGSIEVETAPGQGAAFTVVLPLQEGGQP